MPNVAKQLFGWVARLPKGIDGLVNGIGKNLLGIIECLRFAKAPEWKWHHLEPHHS